MLTELRLHIQEIQWEVIQICRKGSLEKRFSCGCVLSISARILDGDSSLFGCLSQLE